MPSAGLGLKFSLRFVRECLVRRQSLDDADQSLAAIANLWVFGVGTLTLTPESAQSAETFGAPEVRLRTPQWFDGISVGNLDSSVNWQEISGLATPAQLDNSDYLWVISDSPANMLGCVSKLDATNMGVYTLATPPAYSDWEDISSGVVNGQAYIYVADFGDNTSVRATITLFRIKEPFIDGLGGVIAATDYEAIVCAYPTGGNAPVSKDAETLIVDPDTGDMYVILKRDTVQKVYSLAYAASYTGTQTLVYEGAMTSIPNVTVTALGAQQCFAVGGCISPDGQSLLIKNYNDVYYFPRNKATQTIMQALQQPLILVPAYVGGGSNIPQTSSPNAEPQGEAICFDIFGFDFSRHPNTSPPMAPPRHGILSSNTLALRAMF